MKIMKSAVVVGLVGLFLAGPATGATIEYRILVDGVHAVQHEVLPDSWHEVTIEGRCVDNDPIGGYPGGILQYCVSFEDSTGIVGLLDADEKMGGPPFNPVPSGQWDSWSAPPMTNYNGDVDVSPPGYDVLGQAGAVPPTAFEDEWNTIGANVWTVLGGGMYLMGIDGEYCMSAVLTLIPCELAGQLIWDPGLWAPRNPDGAVGDETIIHVYPEPATLSLLALGALGLIRRR